MNKLFLKIKTIFLVFIVTACSYKPIFIQKEYSFEIKDVLFVGDSEVNRLIDNKLNLIKNKKDNTKRQFDLSIETKKKKNIISQDSKGDPLKYELIIIAKFEVKENGNLILNRKIEKNNIYNNASDKFELERSEYIIIENISDKISEDIISSIVNLDDN
tara:strand:+ start:22 stop:498 length:477 start_codon:yes stop_codon:yes gene_type:complete